MKLASRLQAIRILIGEVPSGTVASMSAASPVLLSGLVFMVCLSSFYYPVERLHSQIEVDLGLLERVHGDQPRELFHPLKQIDVHAHEVGAVAVIGERVRELM